jgi:hypothetical protein
MRPLHRLCPSVRHLLSCLLRLLIRQDHHHRQFPLHPLRLWDQDHRLSRFPPLVLVLPLRQLIRSGLNSPLRRLLQSDQQILLRRLSLLYPLRLLVLRHLFLLTPTSSHCSNRGRLPCHRSRSCRLLQQYSFLRIPVYSDQARATRTSSHRRAGPSRHQMRLMSYRRRAYFPSHRVNSLQDCRLFLPHLRSSLSHRSLGKGS